MRPLLKYANYVSGKFSNEILNLPLKYGGYGVYKIHKVMVCEQVKMLLTTLRVDDNTGCKMRSLLEFHQMESGSRKSILEMGEEELFLLTNSWIKKLVISLRRLGLWIRTDHWKPEGGETVMDCLAKHGETREWTEKMNLCRLRFQILWVGDLYRIDGRLCESSKELGLSNSTLKWPNTPIPKRWENWW